MTTANEEETILSFAGSYAKLKDAISRSADISKSIAEPQLKLLERARNALGRYWPFLQDEECTSDDDRKSADDLGDLMSRETFYRELPKIDQAAGHLQKLYEAAFSDAAKLRLDCYLAAVDSLKSTPGWEQLDEERQLKIAEPLTSRTTEEVPASTPIPQLRADIDACDKRLADAVAEVHRLIEGDRIVRVKVGSHFANGIDTEEQLDAALGSLREECAHYIAKNKRILIQ